MASATVLVVDDDPVILKLLEVNFEMEGFQVVRAADGAEGLERARAVLPDIVVLDVMMPRMTGYEVAKALREDSNTAHIPIIFVTARAQSSDVERGMELGIDDYVTKPFDPLDLIARVNTLLARSQAAAETNGEAVSGSDVPAPSAGPPPLPSTAQPALAADPGDGAPSPGEGTAPGSPSAEAAAPGSQSAEAAAPGSQSAEAAAPGPLSAEAAAPGSQPAEVAAPGPTGPAAGDGGPSEGSPH